MEDIIRFNSKEVEIPSINIQLLYLEHCVYNNKKRGACHSHSFWQAEIVLAGKIKVFFKDKKIILKEGSVLIIPPGVQHAFEYEGDHTEYISFKFSCTGAETVNNPHVYGNEYGTEYLCNYLLSIMQNYDTDRRLISVHIQNSLKTFLELEIVYGVNLSPKSLPDQIRDILKRSGKSFPSVSKVADEVGLSRPYISRLIKTETGLSLKPFIDREYIEIAKQMLRMSDLNISEIAQQLGFKDLFSFSKFFKRIEKISPTEFHQQYIKDHEEQSTASVL